MKNENVEIKTNEVNLGTAKNVVNFTRKDWFAMFYEVFQVIDDNRALNKYKNELVEAIYDAHDVIKTKNYYEKNDKSLDDEKGIV